MKHFFERGILPAVTIADSDEAVAVAQAIMEGGLTVMEIPFRTKAALTSIANIKASFPEMHVGAGTLLTPKQVREAKESGAEFGLSPGFNPSVVKEALALDFPFIPGIMTPSEIESALELGCIVQKLFPAGPSGGLQMLRALMGPYGHTGVKFIPMGGVSLGNMKEYLDEANVLAIGGSWLATKALIASGDFGTITKNVQAAIAVAKSRSG